jgi:hypothetical membrane protein
LTEPSSVTSTGRQASSLASRARAHLRAYAICGLVAPIFFALMVVLESSLVTGYNQIAQPISDLGASALYGSYSILQDVNFLVFGILVIALAIGLGQALRASRAISWSLGFFGSMIFLAGLFQDEPAPWPAGAHGLVSVFAFISIILTQFFTWRRLRRSTGEEGEWGKYSRFSLITMGLTIILFASYGVLGQPGSSIGGLVQRVFLAVPWLWIEVISLKLLRLA